MTAVPDEGASQLKQAQVIGGLLVVAHQYPPALGEPTQGAFHTHRRAGKVFSPRRSSFSSPMRRICGQYRKAATVPWPVGLSYPLSRHRFWVPSGPATTMLSKVGLKSFVSWTLAPVTTTLRGPPAASTRMLFLLPALPRSVGLRPIAPPPTALYPWSNPPTAIPSPPRPTPGILRSGQPRCPPAPHLPPSAGRSDGWCYRLPTPWASGSTGNRCASER